MGKNTHIVNPIFHLLGFLSDSGFGEAGGKITPMNYELFKSRYEAARQKSLLSETEIADLAGISRDKLRNFVRRDVPPKDLLSVAKVARVLKVHPLYFLSPLGLDSSFLSNSLESDLLVDFTDDPNEIALLSLFRDLDDRQRALAFKMLRAALADGNDDRRIA